MSTNIKIKYDYSRGNFPYMEINKKDEVGNDAVSSLVMAGMRLKNGEIHELIINDYKFTKASFLTKSTRRWNQSLYTRVAVNAYEIDLINEIANS